MPKSQRSDIATALDDTSSYPENQMIRPNEMICQNRMIKPENQASASIRELSTIEQMRLEEARVTNILCALLIFGLIAACVITFCITKSIFSFSFLSFLSPIPKIRRRQEEAIFPMGPEDLQIKLKEQEVEIARIEKQSTPIGLVLFAWLRRILGKMN